VAQHAAGVRQGGTAVKATDDLWGVGAPVTGGIQAHAGIQQLDLIGVELAIPGVVLIIGGDDHHDA
jgi:hypothetical protein